MFLEVVAEICENLRMSSRTDAIPVLLVTSRVAETSEGGFPCHFKAGGFWRKPFEPDELLVKMKRLAGTKSRFAALGTAVPVIAKQGINLVEGTYCAK